ncbi:MAG: TAXI family TRAP transporter solute-binding subunit [Bilophila wadsworthia]
MHHFLKTVLLSCALLALGAMPSQSAESLRCVSAANPSGTWYIGMGAVGKAYTNMNPGTDVTMLPGGGATNAPRLASRAADMGVAENSMLNAFKTGLEPYKAPTPKGIATVANLWDRINYQIVSPVSSPVKDLRDLKTMKNVNIGVGSTGGSTEKIFRNILKEYGITYEDIKKNGGKVVTNGFDDIANMVKDGQIDVFVRSAPAKRGSSSTCPAASPEVPEYRIRHRQEGRRYPRLQRRNLARQFYKGKVGPDVTTLWDTNAIIVRDNLDEESAYRLTQAVIEGRDDIALANPAWKSIDPAKAWQGTVYPLHPGAARYYKEKGYMN